MRQYCGVCGDQLTLKENLSALRSPAEAEYPYVTVLGEVATYNGRWICRPCIYAADKLEMEQEAAVAG